MLSLFLFAAAHAQDPEAEEPEEPEEPSEPTEPTAEPAPEAPAAPAEAMPETPALKKRKYLMQVNFRGGYMFLPDSILDIWYFKHDGEGFERPQVGAYNLGIEFAIQDGNDNGIFYVEYINPLIKEGYWDDVEEPPDYADGSYLKADKFGVVAIGANYAYAIKAGPVFEFLISAGLGVGIKVGNLTEWQPGEPEDADDANNVDANCGRDEAAYERATHCGDDGTINMPGAIPYLDVNIGPRFNFSDRASLRLQAGLHVLPYGGAAVGITF